MLIQVILLGDGTVGKTSICHRFTNDTFQREYKQTIGLDFFLKRFELEGDVQVALQVWDIGGQSIGSKMLGNYIYGSHAIVFAYDCTNVQSFTNIEDWCGGPRCRPLEASTCNAMFQVQACFAGVCRQKLPRDGSHVQQSRYGAPQSGEHAEAHPVCLRAQHDVVLRVG